MSSVNESKKSNNFKLKCLSRLQNKSHVYVSPTIKRVNIISRQTIDRMGERKRRDRIEQLKKEKNTKKLRKELSKEDFEKYLIQYPTFENNSLLSQLQGKGFGSHNTTIPFSFDSKKVTDTVSFGKHSKDIIEIIKKNNRRIERQSKKEFKRYLVNNPSLKNNILLSEMQNSPSHDDEEFNKFKFLSEKLSKEELENYLIQNPTFENNALLLQLQGKGFGSSSYFGKHQNAFANTNSTSFGENDSFGSGSPKFSFSKSPTKR